MPLEAVMICMDNSDYMRNCDYGPSRFEAQADAVHLVCGAKTQQNPESSVGILTVAGDRVEVLVTPTTDLGQMISGLPGVTIGGDADLLRGLQVAQLALKHRQNKNQKQRIVAFVGSPVEASEKELETLGKNLKKNNIALDLVSFGETEENTEKLQKLLAAVNSNDMSHLLEVKAGPKLLSDAVLSSAVIYPDGDAPFGSAGGGDEGFGLGDGFDFGDDPELALALRISMEEERARQEKLQQQADEESAAVAESAAQGGGGGTASASSGAAPDAEGSGGGAAAAALPVANDASLMEALGAEDMDEELRAALLASLQEEEARAAPPEVAGGSKAEEPPPSAAPAAEAPAAAATAPATAEAPPPPAAEAAQESAAMGDAAAGVPETAGAAGAATDATAEAGAAASKNAGAAAGADVAIDTRWFQDAAFVQELLGSLPGVDINDQAVQSAIRQAQERAARPPSSGGGGAPK